MLLRRRPIDQPTTLRECRSITTARYNQPGQLLADRNRTAAAHTTILTDGECARTQSIVAIKVVAHKLARAGYYIPRNQVPFDVNNAFA
ncbi:MAG: hypothetical protein WCA32_11410 [Chromatiaceae bacterium]